MTDRVTGTTAELIALLLAAVLAFAMAQPLGLPEAIVAVPAAGLTVALGFVGPSDALAQVRALGPTVGFLAAVLVLAPVVSSTAARLRLRPKPPGYACTHLAHSASTLLPVSNLTNLLAFGASGLSFLGYGTGRRAKHSVGAT